MRASLKKRVGDWRGFGNALLQLAEDTPERVTLSQMTFFTHAALADLMGSPATLTDLKETLCTLRRTIHSTYKIFLDPSPQFPNGLGWLKQIQDQRDKRVKHIHLTEDGLKTIKKALDTLHRT